MEILENLGPVIMNADNSIPDFEMSLDRGLLVKSMAHPRTHECVEQNEYDVFGKILAPALHAGAA